MRIVCATNADLQRLAREGKFKEDLLDRLSFEVLFLPPLRARGEDIMLLANYFATRMATECQLEDIPYFSPEAEKKLKSYFWPGNIRELKNTVERAVYRSRSQEIDDIEFNPFLNPFQKLEEEDKDAPFPSYFLKDYPSVHDDVDVFFLSKALRESDGNQRRAAERLGITYDQFRGIYRKLSERIKLALKEG